MRSQHKTVCEHNAIPAMYEQLHVGGRAELPNESDMLRWQLFLLAHPLQRSLYKHQQRLRQLRDMRPCL